MNVIEKQVFEGVRIEADSLIRDWHFKACRFANCFVGRIVDSDPPLVVRNVMLDGCVIWSCYLGRVILEDVTIRNLKAARPRIGTGMAFLKNVVLEGEISEFLVDGAGLITDPVKRQQFETAQDQFYATVDWALDITRASIKSFSCHGIPARFIRRDPKTQVLVTNERIQVAIKKGLDLMSLKEGLRLCNLGHWYDEIIIPAPPGKKRTMMLDAFEEWRRYDLVEDGVVG